MLVSAGDPLPLDLLKHALTELDAPAQVTGVVVGGDQIRREARSLQRATIHQGILEQRFEDGDRAVQVPQHLQGPGQGVLGLDVEPRGDGRQVQGLEPVLRLLSLAVGQREPRVADLQTRALLARGLVAVPEEVRRGTKARSDDVQRGLRGRATT